MSFLFLTRPGPGDGRRRTGDAPRPRDPETETRGRGAGAPLLLFLAAWLLGSAGARSAQLTTTNVQPGGTDWTAAIWKTNGAGRAVGPPVAGNTYVCVSNGVAFGNNTANTRIRHPTTPVAGLVTFPGDSLTLNTNTELRLKQSGGTVHFPGTGTNAGLILNGGVINIGDDTVLVVTGRVRVASQSYLSPGDAGGAVKPLRGLTLQGALGGSGNFVLMLGGTTTPQTIAGVSNPFSGQWIVKAGWLLGSGVGSLGTNSVLVDPAYVLPLSSSILDARGPAIFEPGYDLNSAGTLTLTNGGVMRLHQECCFSAVKINGAALTSGTHAFAELATRFPASFSPGGWGSLTVQPYGPPPVIAPTLLTQPLSGSLLAGGTTQLVVTASGTLPLGYQWQKGSNGLFTPLADGGSVSGSRSNLLTLSSVTAADGADYRLRVTNSAGAATSLVATLTILFPETNHPTVRSLDPPAGAAVSHLTQIQVTFTTNVVGVEPADLLINGISAAAVSGSGASYVFSFTQPPAGTVVVEWAADQTIYSLGGNPLDVAGAWTYTLVDTLPPDLLSTAPPAGATVGALTQVQVCFTEPVTGVDAADLLLNGAPATNVTGTGFGPYLFQFPQPPDGAIVFTWVNDHGIRDWSAPANLFPGTAWTVTLDAAAAAAALTNVVINEFLAANIGTNGLRDEDLDLSDWLELRNRGNTTVNLAGWSLTDDAGTPGKWTLPATNLAAGQYLVLFASGKNRQAAGAPLHANFSLSAAGEYLGLHNAEIPPRLAHQYAPRYPDQRNDISYGLDDAGAARYFPLQTPGGPNGNSALTGTVAEVHFSVSRGFFNQPFNLALTSRTPGARIRYTTDGSPPTEDSGTLYTSPLPIVTTTILRAAAYGDGLLSSPVHTCTYLFPGAVVAQPPDPPGFPSTTQWTTFGWTSHYGMSPAVVTNPLYRDTLENDLLSLPALSIVLRTEDMFGADHGLYTHPAQAREAACSIEWISPDGSAGFQCDSGIKMHGGSSRVRTLKHPFRLLFKGIYGNTKLEYPVFPDSPVSVFDQLDLRADYNNHWTHGSDAAQRARGGLVRDAVMKDLHAAMGAFSSHSRYVHLYINGLYWGVYNPCERPDAAFAASYLGGDRTDYDAFNGTGGELVDGDRTARSELLRLNTSALAELGPYEQIRQYLDVQQYIDYLIVQLYGGNWDWGAVKNWYAVRRREPGAGFQYLCWDSERTFEGVSDQITVSPDGLQTNLVRNPEYRLAFADRVHRHFFNGGALTSASVSAAWRARAAQIDRAIVAESARWGDSVPDGKTTLSPLPYAAYTTNTPYTRDENWLGEQGRLLSSYFPARSGNVLAQFVKAGLYPAITAPSFNQHGGTVPPGFNLVLTPATNTLYYTTDGSDPRVYGVGTPAPNALVYSGPILLLSNTVLKARAWTAAGWSALNEATFAVAGLGIPVRITELMYHPIGGDAYEFIELQNLGSSPVDLSGFSFQGVNCVLPDGTRIEPGAVLVIASAAGPALFAGRYPGVIVGATFTGALANGGERIALLDRNGSTVVSVDYDNAGGWPVAAAGGGYSLEILHPNGDPDDPANWQASSAAGGSPGVAPAAPNTPAVRLNEIMAENAGAVLNNGTWPDWLELFNASTNSVSLDNWSLSRSGDAREYVFPAGTSLAPGGYLVVWCDAPAGAPGLHTGFALGRNGESLFLYDAATNRIDAFTFGLQLTNYSIGRLGADSAWLLTLPTPGSNNLAALTGSTTNLVINEWLANSLPGSPDWLELFNRDPERPVALDGLYLATSNDLFQVRAASFLAPHGFVQWIADKDPGVDHLDFKLSAAGDSIALFDSAGLPLDRVSFGSQAEGVSQGRYPDGSATIADFPGSPSPGAGNYLPSCIGPILNEMMARNVSARYDARGLTPDWIELFNPGTATWPLAGMSLGTAAGHPGQWVFPAGASIGSGQHLLVWCDPSRPASTGFEQDLNAGFALDADGGALYLFATNGWITDAVSFGFQLADQSIGRADGTWCLLSRPTPGTTNTSPAALGGPAGVRLNEWMANPTNGGGWFELFNPGALPVCLTGLHPSDSPSLAGMTNFTIGPLSFIAGHGWARFEADNDPSQGPGHAPFALDNDGETLRLYDTSLALLDSVDFGLQSRGVSEGRLPDGGSAIVSFPATPTPGESNYLPLENVLVNEVLTHTDLPLEDAIELYNPSPADLPIGGWFISNSQSDPRKFSIPPGTVLNAGGYRVFYEFQFNGTNSTPFTLNSAHGDQVLVSASDSLGNLTGYRAQVAFGPAGNGVSIGRVPTSVGTDFVALADRTFGADHPDSVALFRTGTGLANSLPRVGPVVLNEIHYHPVTGTNENSNEEFLELFNITPNPVPLFDPAAPTNCWKLTGGVEFTFPPGVTLPPGGYLLVVGFDPASALLDLANFRAKYGVPAGSLILGPFEGRLNNAGESLDLSAPDTPQTAPHPDAGFVPYVLIERVTYADTAPWPADADGTGASLQRRLLGSYANEPLHWSACAPTPGRRNCFSDADVDGLPDDWELANGLNPLSSQEDDGAAGDPDHDGFTNQQEYLAGTNPLNSRDFLRIQSAAPTGAGAGITLRFAGLAGRSYSVLYCDSLIAGSWQKLLDVGPLTISEVIEVPDPAAGETARFYRLVTPGLPVQFLSP